jgi:hypothetical protein
MSHSSILPYNRLDTSAIPSLNGINLGERRLPEWKTIVPEPPVGIS